MSSLGNSSSRYITVAVASLVAAVWLAGCASLSGSSAGDAAPVARGTGDLGVVIERASGQLSVVETSGRTALARVDGLGDLSHASVVFSRDARYAYVFGRDGGLSKVDLLSARVVARVIQSGNAIGGAISQDGRMVVVQNYEPGGIKAFDAETLDEMELAIGARPDLKNLEDAIGHDLAVSGLPAPLYLPNLAGFAQGPGFPNLSCLGELSNRVLRSAVDRSAVAGSAARVGAI